MIRNAMRSIESVVGQFSRTDNPVRQKDAADKIVRPTVQLD